MTDPVQHPDGVNALGRKASTLRIAISKAVHDDYDGLAQRHQLLILYMSMALEHFDAIFVLLYTGKLIGSAMALLRPLVEASVRALWIVFVATDQQVEAVATDTHKFQVFDTLIADLDRSLGNKSTFAGLGGKNWKALCGLTHTGAEQLARRLRPEGIVDIPYDEGEIIDIMQYAAAAIFMFALGFCGAMQRVDQRRSLISLYDRLFGDASPPGPLERFEP